MKEGYNMPQHSNRIFSVRFDRNHKTRVVSGGWDNMI